MNTDLKLSMIKKMSGPMVLGRVRPATDRKVLATDTKFKMVRRNSYKDAPLSKFIYNEDHESNEKNFQAKNEEIEQPEVQRQRRRTMGDVKDNPFLAMKRDIAEKDKLKSLKSVKQRVTFPAEEGIWTPVESSGCERQHICFRDVRQEVDQMFLIEHKLKGMI